MYGQDNRRHHLPHVHVYWAGQEVVVELTTGTVLAGSLERSKLRKAQSWINDHQSELVQRWTAAVEGQRIDPID
ncbi:MAG: DUF4160 domain-containing protein [Bacteroidota bacterium]